MKTQHSENVEISVMKSLREALVPSDVFSNWQDYLAREVNPSQYSCALQFKKAYAYYSFLRKWKGIKMDVSPSSVALATWLKSELKCFQTNRRLSLEAATGFYSVAPSIISDAQRKVASILGPVNMDAISQLCRFGNGATFDLRRGSTHSEKYRRPSVTFDAIPIACQILSGDRYAASLVGPLRNLKVVRANRMVMVPKNAKTDRPIAAEPTLNSYIQQGIGRFIRHRLKRSGVDLDDQTINQDLARRAIFEGLSTLDLSSASDTLCINLVKLLLPRDWFELLDAVRSPLTLYGGRYYILSKFSSMGNAYTFELESLLFYVLCSCVSVNDVSVYGDDLIVSNQDEPSVREILTWAGFDVNHDKSFGEGSRFYESCGKHYFDGVEVTPCYQKDVCHRPHDYVRLHNRLVRAGIRLDLRMEFNASAKLVRDECRRKFGRDCPGIGPLVEYDEYFIREDYTWSDPNADSFCVMSAITVPKVRKSNNRRDHVAYYGRKLRSPGFLNPALDGQVSESLEPKLLVTKKYHWRSATFGNTT